MNEQQLENAFDSIIDRFREESAKALDYCNDYGIPTHDAITQQNKAMEHALHSLKKLITTHAKY